MFRPLGGQISARASAVLPSVPPAMSTCPLPSNVAVCPVLVTIMSPVAVNVPVTGSNNSASG